MSWQLQAAGSFLGLLFVFTASSKVLHPQLALAWLKKIKCPRSLAIMAWALATASESGIALNWWVGGPIQASAMASLGLLSLYSLLLLIAHLRGHRSACSCYGSWMRVTPQQGIQLNAMYSAMIVWVWSEASPASFGFHPWTPYAALAALMVGVFRLKFK